MTTAVTGTLDVLLRLCRQAIINIIAVLISLKIKLTFVLSCDLDVFLGLCCEIAKTLGLRLYRLGRSF